MTTATMIMNSQPTVPDAVAKAVQLAQEFGFAAPADAQNRSAKPLRAALPRPSGEHAVVLHCWKCGG